MGQYTSYRQSLVDCVVEHLGAQKATRVVLEAGKLSGVVLDALRFCFDICAQGTLLQGAMLEILEPAGRVRCHQCGARADLQDAILLCSCGSANVELLSGSELKIKQVEVSSNV